MTLKAPTLPARLQLDTLFTATGPMVPHAGLNDAHLNPDVEHICCKLVSYNCSLFRNEIFNKKIHTHTNTKMPL